VNVLLVSYHFPPFNAMGAVAVGRLSAGLAARGHRVHVVGCANPGLPPTLELDTGAASVERVAHPFRPPAADDDVAPSPARRLGTPRRLTARAGRLARRWWSIPDGEAPWSVAAGRAGTRLGAATGVDVVVASGPPHSALVAGARVARRLDVPLVLSLRDLWTDNPYLDLWSDDPYLGGGRVKRALERRLEARVLRRAAVAFVSTGRSGELLQGRHPGLRVLTLMNGVDEIAPDRRRGPSEAPLRILHTGSVIEGARDPTPLFLALGRLAADGVAVEAHFHGTNSHLVLDGARRVGVSELVRVHDLGPHAATRAAQRDADVLLILQWDDDRERAICPGKLFEYLGARRPVLSVGPTGGVVDEIVAATGRGLVTTDPERIATWLREQSTAKRTGGLADLPVEPIEPYRRDVQLDAFDEVLRSLPVAENEATSGSIQASRSRTRRWRG
jgi:hypothetical protein